MKKTVGIVTEYNQNCAICGRPTEEEHHLLFGTGLRELAEMDGIKIPICSNCHTLNPVTQRIHDNSMAEKLSKVAGQLAWEKHYIAQHEGVSEADAREKFRSRYHNSWL